MKVALVTPSITFGGGIETPVVQPVCRTNVNGNRSARLRNPLSVGHRHRYAKMTSPCILLTVPTIALHIVWRERLNDIRREHARKPFDLLHALWLHEPGTIAVAAGAMLGIPVIASVGGAEVVAIPDIEYGALRLARGRFMTAGVLLRATMITAGSTYALRLLRTSSRIETPRGFVGLRCPSMRIDSPQPTIDVSTRASPHCCTLRH